MVVLLGCDAAGLALDGAETPALAGAGLGAALVAGREEAASLKRTKHKENQCCTFNMSQISTR